MTPDWSTIALYAVLGLLLIGTLQLPRLRRYLERRVVEVRLERMLAEEQANAAQSAPRDD